MRDATLKPGTPSASGGVPTRRWRWPRPTWLLLLLAALALVAIANRVLDSGGEGSDPAGLADLPLSYGPRDYAAAVAFADRNVASAEDRLRQAPGDWLSHEILARALYGRSRLTGSFDDLRRASETVQRGVALAPEGSGPVMTGATIALAVHRTERAAGLIAVTDGFAVPPPDDERAEAQAIKGDIAYHQGRYGDARVAYGLAMRIAPSGGTAYRLAILETRLGNPDRAIADFVEAGRLTGDRSAPFIANLLLQCGAVEMERGDWPAAERLFALADRRFPGHWLTLAYRSQMHAAKGEFAAARKGYLAILADADRPEVMDALALVYRAEGDVAKSRRWAAKAEAIWRARMVQLPDATAAHFAEHLMAFGKPAEALAAARTAYRGRPNGDQAMLLAAARIGAGQPGLAVRVLQAEERKGWRTAALYRQMESGWALQGASERAEQARAAALALNPLAMDGGNAMLRFGHY